MTFGLAKAEEAAALGKYLKGAVWAKNGFIVLNGCDVGLQKQNSIGQMVANETGRLVYASMAYNYGNGFVLTNATNRGWLWWTAPKGKSPAPDVTLIERSYSPANEKNWGSQPGFRLFFPS